MGICILCNQEKATTREHIFKADRYRDILGNRPSLYIRDGEKEKSVRSYKNKLLKPKKNLCSKCNSSRSQRADLIFSDFDKYVHLEIGRELSKNCQEINIEVSEFFTNRDSLDYLHFIRYFAKYIACQLDRYDYEIPEILRSIFITGEGFRNLKVKINGDGRFVKYDIMRNNGLGVLTKGVPGDSVIKLAKDGVFPEEVHTKIQHGPVIYELVLCIPEEEIVKSANRALTPHLETVFQFLKVPASVQDSIKSAPDSEKAELAIKVMEEYFLQYISSLGIPKFLFKGFRLIFRSYYLTVNQLKSSKQKTQVFIQRYFSGEADG
ncbi:MAG: hypothetical protein CL678_17645 [Bdellovibrionaceae bacterium]|nr:hypothetical protein [Pseudobdellovibrionaceae bacterium]|tara:strand:+ start:1314 stop:2279 length:966 start_codon:yes stop_codon:yes gene_type:complete